MPPPTRWTTCLLLPVLLTAAAAAQTSYPPLVPQGEVLEDLETLLDDLTRREAFVSKFVEVRLLGFLHPIAFSSDGKTLASASFDSTVRLWNLTTGELIRTLEGHAGGVLSVAFSPDGKILASASSDRTVRLWDVATGELTRILGSHADGVPSVAFSPDGKTLASGSYDRTVRLWDVAGGELLKTLEGHAAEVLFVAFGPDGKTLASASYDRTVRLWDIATGELARIFQGHADRVLSVAFSSDSKTLASASYDRTVRLWNIATGEVIRAFEGHADWVLSVAFSPDGKTLASASYERAVRLWDIATGELIRTLEGHAEWVRSVAFSPDGKTLASASSDCTVRVWNVVTGELTGTLERHTSWVLSIAFSPDGKTLASASYDHTVGLWDIATGKLRRPLKGHASLVFSVAFSPDGKTLALASADSTVRLWDIATDELKENLEGHAKEVLSVAFRPNGKTLASASSDRTVRLWDITTGELNRTLEGHADAVSSVAFSPDGKTLASASDDHSVRLWNVAAGELIHTLEGHTSWVFSVAFSPDGKTLASASYDQTVRLWNVATGKLIQTLEEHASRVLSVAFSPDGKTLASGSTKILLGERTDGFHASRIFLGGRRGTWISCRLGGRCLRHDDGTLLLRRTEDGRFESVMPQVELQPAQLELDPVLNAIETVDGRSSAITLRIRNVGPHRAFWLRVRRTDDPGDDPLVVALPPSWVILDPDEIAELSVRVSTHSAHDHPVAETSTFSLEITSLHGEPLGGPPITVRSKVPSLEWNEARWLESDGSRNVTVELTNTGGLELPGPQLAAELSGVDAPLDVVERRAIAPGETIRVPFGLPPDVEITDEIRVTLVVRKLQLPVHVWEFADQPIRSPLPSWALPAAVAAFLLAVTVLILFTHPLVRRLSAEPSALLRRPPSELPKARILLRLTGRLGTVLAGAEVDQVLLDRAINFFSGNEADARLSRLAARLGLEAQATAELRVLPLGASFPLNLDRCLVHLPPSGRPASEVLAWLRARPETRDQVTLVVTADPAAQDALHRKAASDLATLHVVPSGADLTELLLSPDPVRVLARVIASQVRRTRVSPYQTRGGVNREAFFFGRDDLLADVLNRDPANYLVVGGRQLGKSSLLKAIQRRLADDPRVDARYLVLSGGDLAGALAYALGLPRDAGLGAVLERLGTSERRTLFLIDEADALVEEHRRPPGGTAETGEDLFGRLRSLSEEGRCHFILAGFWHLYEAAALDYWSPLRNFGETLRVGALEEDACVALATVPMADMGLAYEDENLVERLVERTGRRANLIAIACDEILKNLDPGARTIGAADVDAALGSWAIQEAIEGWKDLTGKEESRLDRVLVYATIDRDAFTLAEVLETLAGHGPEVDADRVERSLKRLELAWVVGPQEPPLGRAEGALPGGAFSYRVPLFVDRVRGQDPASLLRAELKRLA